MALSAGQQLLLKQLNTRILGYTASSPKDSWMKDSSLCTDTTKIRFLKAANWKVHDAIKRLIKTSRWRYKYSVNSLVETWDKEENNLALVLTHGIWPIGPCGFDNMKRPVYVMYLTGVDFPGLLREVKIEIMTRYMVYLMEKIIQENPSGQGVLIVDAGVDSMASGTRSELALWIKSTMIFFRKIAKILEQHYPESLGRIFFTRVPKYFMTSFRLTKPFIASNTLSKVEILNEPETMNRLLMYMPIETVPELFGGQSRNVTGLGGKIPKGAMHNEEYMIQIKAHVRLLKSGLLQQYQSDSTRFSLSRTPEQEREIQEMMALEMVKHSVQDMKHVSAGAHLRGSWNFVPGLDWLANADDATILAQLQKDKMNPTEALEHLKEIAIQKENEMIILETTKKNQDIAKNNDHNAEEQVNEEEEEEEEDDDENDNDDELDEHVSKAGKNSDATASSEKINGDIEQGSSCIIF